MIYCNFLYGLLINMFLIIFSVNGMEELSVNSMRSQSLLEISNKFSTLRKEINKAIDNNPRVNEQFIVTTLDEMLDAKILSKGTNYLDYLRDETIKPKIIQQFFTQYPTLICPELQLILTNINYFHDRQDFITILSTIKSTNQSIMNSVNDLIQLTNTDKFEQNKDFYPSLTALCSNLQEEYSPGKKSQITIVEKKKGKEKELFLLTTIKKQQEILNDLPTEQIIHGPKFFESFFNTINQLTDAIKDPKEDKHLVALMRLNREELEKKAVDCINAIVTQYPSVIEQLSATEERFKEHSLSFLSETVKHNTEELKRRDLFESYQQIITEKQTKEPILIEQPIIQTQTIETQPQQSKTILQLLRQKVVKPKQPSIIIERPTIQQPEPASPGLFYQTVTFVFEGIKNFFISIFNFVFPRPQ